ncbi:MAG: nucleotidyltransferase domain-containing protein [Bacteroidota bacterium]
MTIQIEDKYLKDTGLTSQFIREELALLLFGKGILNVEQASGLAQKDLVKLQEQKRKIYRQEIKNHALPLAIKDAITQHYPLAKLILFGSKARGEDSKHSDWDFLILLEEKIDRNIQDKIRRAVSPLELNEFLGEVISYIIRNKDEWEKFSETLLYKEIAKDGIII